MRIKFEEIKNLYQKYNSWAKVAQELSKKYQVKIHKGSVYRAFKNKRDLIIRDKNRVGSFMKLGAHDQLKIFQLIEIWAPKATGEPISSIKTQELVDRAKDFVLRLESKSEDKKEIKKYIIAALKNYLFVHKKDWAPRVYREKNLIDDHEFRIYKEWEVHL